MKKIGIICACILLLNLCACKSEKDYPTVPKEIWNDTGLHIKQWYDSNGILREEGIYPNNEWENPELTFVRDCVPNAETAIQVTEVYLKSFQSQHLWPDLSLVVVTFDTEDRVWVVTYSEEPNYPGACLSFAVRQDTGEVIKMWAGE
jgi:hypothetical protein